VVFDETNSSQIEQFDLDLIDDEEASCDALQRMSIGDVRSQDPSNQPQETFLNDTTPPAQGLDQDNHEEDVEPNDQDQEESNDQEGDEDDGDKGEAPPHPRVRQNIQRDHPVDNILGDIKKGVTTRSHVAIFCEHYSFISSFEPFKVEDALHDPRVLEYPCAKFDRVSISKT
jgi:TATA-binding protein-associated factor Taf7